MTGILGIIEWNWSPIEGKFKGIKLKWRISAKLCLFTPVCVFIKCNPAHLFYLRPATVSGIRRWGTSRRGWKGTSRRGRGIRPILGGEIYRGMRRPGKTSWISGRRLQVGPLLRSLWGVDRRCRRRTSTGHVPNDQHQFEFKPLLVKPAFFF